MLMKLQQLAHTTPTTFEHCYYVVVIERCATYHKQFPLNIPRN